MHLHQLNYKNMDSMVFFILKQVLPKVQAKGERNTPAHVYAVYACHAWLTSVNSFCTLEQSTLRQKIETE